MDRRIPNALRIRPTTALPPPLIVFLNAMAFGLVLPLLYFVGDLSDGSPIGMLFLFDSIGRIFGGVALTYASRRLPLMWIQIIWQTVATVSFGLLAIAGHLHGGRTPAFAMLFLFSSLAGFSMSRFPSMRLLMPFDRGGGSTSSIMLLGLITGCAICAIPVDHHQQTILILSTGILKVPAVCAVILCGLIGVIPLLWSSRFPANQRWFPAAFDPAPSVTDRWKRNGSLSVLMACEAAFAITMCVEPLMGWESFGFSPAGIAVLLVLGGCLSLSVRKLKLPSIWQGRFGGVGSLCLGMFFLMLSSIGFTISCTLSRSMQSTTHQASLMAFYAAAMLAAVSHGLLQTPLQLLLPSPRLFKAGTVSFGLKPDIMVSLVSSMAALGVSVIWAPHERITFLLPAVLSGGAMMIVVLPGIARTARPTLKAEPRQKHNHGLS